MNLKWSYSFLSTYKRCKLQAEARYVTRTYGFTETKEKRFGNHVHKSAELFIKELIPAFPEDIRDFQKIVEKVKGSGRFQAEHYLAVNREWKTTLPKSKDAWGTCKIDAYTIVDRKHALIFDWKTGKQWEDPYELEIQAVFLKTIHPDLETAHGCYVWLKDKMFGEMYDLGAQIEETKRDIEKTMHEAETTPWSPTKNALCGWCDYQHCRYWKETRR